MEIKRYFIKNIGTVCYDEQGITFPGRIPIKLYDLMSNLRFAQPLWECQYGWSNQPRVLSFLATNQEVKAIEAALPIGLVVCKYWAL